MRRTAITRQLIAFVAAGVIVFTGIDVFILWRNQSAERVMNLGAGHVVYQTADLAIGEDPANGRVTVLRFTPDGGWVIAGSGRWLPDPAVRRHALVAVIPSNAIGGGWLCAVQKDTRVTSIQIIDTEHPQRSQTFDFHRGGIAEPLAVDSPLLIRGEAGGHTAFSVKWTPSS
ncbi:MAG: hypothetical protein IRZ33_09285 [Alicyclobacillaceae bacterium]|nr:hypothetical protein [Alicyclobacillaceae bacterium]